MVDVIFAFNIHAYNIFIGSQRPLRRRRRCRSQPATHIKILPPSNRVRKPSGTRCSHQQKSPLQWGLERWRAPAAVSVYRKSTMPLFGFGFSIIITSSSRVCVCTEFCCVCISSTNVWWCVRFCLCTLARVNTVFL